MFLVELSLHDAMFAVAMQRYIEARFHHGGQVLVTEAEELQAGAQRRGLSLSRYLVPFAFRPTVEHMRSLYQDTYIAALRLVREHGCIGQVQGLLAT